MGEDPGESVGGRAEQSSHPACGRIEVEGSYRNWSLREALPSAQVPLRIAQKRGGMSRNRVSAGVMPWLWQDHRHEHRPHLASLRPPCP